VAYTHIHSSSTYNNQKIAATQLSMDVPEFLPSWAKELTREAAD
jgi:hypothetical protein